MPRSAACDEAVQQHARWCGSSEAALARFTRQLSLQNRNKASAPAPAAPATRGTGPPHSNASNANGAADRSAEPQLHSDEAKPVSSLQQQMRELQLGGAVPASAASHQPRAEAPGSPTSATGAGRAQSQFKSRGRGRRPPQSRSQSAQQEHWAAGSAKFPIMTASVKVSNLVFHKFQAKHACRRCVYALTAHPVCPACITHSIGGLALVGSW